jgi:TRAP transporter TAXI family solute receptor
MATVLGRVMNPLADALNKTLPNHFPARVEVIRLTGPVNSAQLIEEGRVELTMVLTDSAYTAYTKGLPDTPGPFRKLRGVAVLYPTPIHLITRENSGIRSLKELKGKRLAIGTSAAQESDARAILEGAGLTLSDVDAKRLTDEQVRAELREGRLDASLSRGNDPSPSIQETMRVPGTRLIPISRSEVERIRTRYPFWHTTAIPPDIYGNTSEIETAGTDAVMICRDDLPEELVYWITRTLFESLPELVRSLQSLRQLDLEQVHASPIPLHPGAARFYRERELFQ